MANFTPQTMGTLFLLLFLLATLYQCVYWKVIIGGVHTYQPNLLSKTDSCNESSVSIVICARNEAENLKKSMPRILSQNYRSYEVIIVNDNSTDNTLDYLVYLRENYTNFVLVNLTQKTAPGKKSALAEGIKTARFDKLLLTDADCVPASEEWLSLMVQTMEGEKTIVLGYGPYVASTSWLNALVRFETWVTAGQYFGWAAKGFPYMGVGRNLAYRAHLVKTSNVLSAHPELASGDDDLTIGQLATAKNTAWVLDPKAYMWSEAPATWTAWWRQKRRHLSTATYYSPFFQGVLGIFSLTWVLHYLGILVFIYTDYYLYAVAAFLLRTCVMLWSCKRLLTELHEHFSIWRVMVLDVGYFLYLIVMSPTLFIKHNRWK